MPASPSDRGKVYFKVIEVEGAALERNLKTLIISASSCVTSVRTAQKTPFPTVILLRHADPQKISSLCCRLQTAAYQRLLFRCLFRGHCTATVVYVTVL
jgi:hypothetical protein